MSKVQTHFPVIRDDLLIENRMERKVLLILLIVVNTVRVYAQGNYQISGKISDVSDGTLLLVRNDGMELDTVATTLVKNGTFMFKGEIGSPFGAYLMTGDGKLNIPFIVEATNIMINVTAKGALIQGGVQQQLFLIIIVLGKILLSNKLRYGRKCNNRGLI